MLEIDSKIYMFRTKEIYFADYPYDVDGYATVTFEVCPNKVDIPGFSRREGTTLVIDLTQDLDTIWKNMSYGNCRKPIRRAERAGVKIQVNQNLQEFGKIYQSFWRKKVYQEARVRPEFIKYGTLFTAEIGGEVLAGHYFLEDDTYIRSIITGSKRLEVDKEKATMIGNTNKLILWEAIKYAKEKGIKEFDLGGVYTGEDKNDPRYTIRQFKQSFGGTLVTRYHYEKVYSKAYKLLRYPYRLMKGQRV